MKPHKHVHGTITLDLRDRIMFASYSGVLDLDCFENVEPRLQALLERLHGSYWAMVANVSGWQQPCTETLDRNATLLADCQNNGMRLLATIVSEVSSSSVNPETQLRPANGQVAGNFQARDFYYVDEALAWFASAGY